VSFGGSEQKKEEEEEEEEEKEVFQGATVFFKIFFISSFSSNEI